MLTISILQKFPKQIVKYNSQYERALANLFIMFAPIAPLFASECWSKFLTVPNRIDADELNFKWDKDVLEQNWPVVDENIDDILVIRVSQIPIMFESCINYFRYGIVLINVLDCNLLVLDKQYKNNSTTN